MIRDLELQSILDDYNACEQGEFSLVTLAFTVATKMVEHNEAEVLNLLPGKLRESVLNIARAYRQDGILESLSSTGKALHNELGARLVSLLDARLGIEGY